MYKLTLNDYEITRDGKIINKTNGRVVKPQKNGKGYLRVSIGGKLQFVHRLVAQKYLPNPENKPQVNHKDGNKLNNSVDNLEWSTNAENRIHAVEKGLHLCGGDCPWSVLTEDNVRFIRSNNQMSIKELSEKFNVSRSTISDIIHYRTWKTVEKIC